MRSMERKYGLNIDDPAEGLHKYSDIPDRIKHTKRSEVDSDWLKRDSDLPCEDIYGTSGVEKRCKRFIV